MKKMSFAFVAVLVLALVSSRSFAGDPVAPITPTPAPQADSADVAWMLTASALVLFMMPGLALFYGGMVRRKNVLATMMQTMAALAVVGVFWISIGYCLAFGESQGGLFGWSPKLLFLSGVEPTDLLPGTKIPIYLHVMFQGMFAIITPALISGAIAERIRFGPYCLFILLWVALVYCPLAHWVWAMNWWVPLNVTEIVEGVVRPVAGTRPVGWLGALGALDFAGGTVVHIAAGFSALAAIILLRRRLGFPEHVFHPNSMVLTLTGAGLLWFGWFGFNAGSALGSGTLAVSTFAATQTAAAAAALSWMAAEWLHKGKPTGLGLASGIVAGLVAVTPASGFIYISGGFWIGLISGLVCYASVCLKPMFKYDDSLDAFGVHGVGGFLGAVLTGIFCFKSVNDAGADGLLAGNPGQVTIQLLASVAAAVFAFTFSLVLVKGVDLVCKFTTDEESETLGLDRTEHAEVGFDFSPAMESVPVSLEKEPRAASIPPNGAKRFNVVVEGAASTDLMHVWSDLCRPGPTAPTPEFRAVYPYLTTVQGNRFAFRGGDSGVIKENLQRLFQNRITAPVRARVEN